MTDANEEARAEARRLKKRGLTYAVIGRRLGYNPETVRRWLKVKAAKQQAAALARYGASDKGKERQRRYLERRRALVALGERTVAAMLD